MGFEQNAKIADSRPDLLFVAARRALFGLSDFTSIRLKVA
jgi:hypothetical protein